MERFGLVGLPNAGKSSLYNALTGGGALAAPYAFATKDPNIGVAKVPDERLDRLAEMSQAATSCTPPCRSSTSAGWSRGPARARASATSSSPTSARSTPSCSCCGRSRTTTCRARPTRSSTCRVVEIELALADLETVEKRLAKRQRQAKLDKRWPTRSTPCRPPTTRSPRARRCTAAGLEAEQREQLAPQFLLTNRRVLAVVNVGEDELDTIPEAEAPRRAELPTPATTSR